MRFGVKLGRTPSGATPHLPAFADFATDGEAVPIDWGRSVAGWPMLKNDTLGDCTIAGLGHLVQAWTSYRGYGQERIMSDDEAEAAYRQIGGWDGVGEGTGIAMVDVLTAWARNGVVVGGQLDVPAAFARIEPTNLAHIRQGLALFGPPYAGVLLPIAAQSQNDWLAPLNLDGDNAPGSWGSHCVVISAIDDEWVTLVTWGGTQRAAIGWWLAYGDEAWSVASADAVAQGSPFGFDLAALVSAMPGLA